jgi:acetyl esterase/lipase
MTPRTWKSEKCFRTALVLMACATIYQAQQNVRTPPFEEMYKMPCVYSVPGMDQVQVRRDIVYKTVEGPDGKVDLKLDLYTPSGAKTTDRFPVVLLISGGGASDHDFRDAGIYLSYARILGASGYVAITFAKRFGRDGDPLQGLTDFNDLVAYIRGHAAQFHAHPGRMAFWAFSAGGSLLSPVLSDMRPYARAALCFYCVTDRDFSSLSADDAQKLRERLSPLVQIERAEYAVPPIFVARAGLDGPGINEPLGRFVTAAVTKNLSIEMMNHPDGHHGFDLLDADARSREIIQRALEFIKARLEGN